MNYEHTKYFSKRFRPLFIWTISLCILSLACSLTDNSVHPSAMPDSSIALEHSLNIIQTEEHQPFDLPSEVVTTSCTVKATVLNLRSCAGIDCPIKAWLLQGETLTVIQPGIAWIKVTTPSGKVGWVKSTYCGGK